MDSLKNEKGADWVRVPFKGGGEATNAILGGSTPIGLLGLGNVISKIQAGKMTALALVNNIRTPLLPETPTLADLGYKGAPSQTWYGLFAPAGTPRPIIDKIAGEVKRVFAGQGLRREIRDQPRPGAGDQHAGRVRRRDQGRPRRRRAGGEGGRYDAAVNCNARARRPTRNPGPGRQCDRRPVVDAFECGERIQLRGTTRFALLVRALPVLRGPWIFRVAHRDAGWQQPQHTFRQWSGGFCLRAKLRLARGRSRQGGEYRALARALGPFRRDVHRA